MEDVDRWINSNNSDGYGSSYDYGSNYGYGYGSGRGYGEGYRHGFGWGCSNHGGYGYCHGCGEGSGYGFGYGNGKCDGKGKGILKINCKEIHVIDGVQTIISHIKGNVAKGFIVEEDLTMTPCYVVKGNGYFAHGKTLREARDSLVEKYMRNMNVEEVIEKFLAKFKKGEKYKGTEFFKWHNYLTGSCLMGREAFVKNHQIDLNEKFTVEEFIDLCKNDYGGNIIKELEEKWKDENDG